MPGFNFGVSSAVPQFNRTPELSVMCARRLFGVEGRYDGIISGRTTRTQVARVCGYG